MGMQLPCGGRVAAGLLVLALLLCSSGSVDLRAEDEEEKLRVRAWQETGSAEERVDIVFVGDGYQRRHLTRTGKYWRDVNRYARELFEEPPFSTYKKLFNVYGVYLESKNVALEGETALGCYFAQPRLLQVRHRKKLLEAVSAAPPADIVFVMVNTEKHGGAGSTLREIQRRGRPLPSPVFSACDTISFQVALHELGHSFAGLGDEYVDEPTATRYPLPGKGKDLPHPNVTLAAHIDVTSREAIRATAKWGRYLDLKGAKRWRWAYEGAYFRTSGVFRPFPRCRMRAGGDAFCPVCCEQIAKNIHLAAGVPWDPEAHLKKHPLRGWR